MRKLQLISLGCSKNRVDSEHLLRQIASGGFSIVPEGADLATAGVDTVVINTCGFIKDAKVESIEAIMQAVDAKNKGYINHIFVFGCLSQRYRQELLDSVPEVDGFFGTLDTDSLLGALGLTFQSDLALNRILTTPSHYAYLKIAEGCDRSCSYCAIPLIRGPHRSEKIEDLVREAQILAEGGVKELLVIAQDTTYYGLDLYKKRMLGKLLEQLSLVEGIEWIRLHYSYPSSFPLDVLQIMAENPKVCNYIDIPLQHSSDKMLSLMRRSIDGKGTRELVENMRKMVPGVVLRTTMIVGHPGEGKRDFQNLLDFVQEYKFERLGAFTYSQEEGTYAALHYKNSVPERVKQERYQALMNVQSSISMAYNSSRVGTTERVLVDSFEDGVLVARSQKESPEVDGEILVGAQTLPSHIAPESLVGKFINVKIIGAGEYDLLAEYI